jgi:hypothetical protein
VQQADATSNNISLFISIFFPEDTPMYELTTLKVYTQQATVLLAFAAEPVH